jgi:hypothetical protein
MNKTKINQTLIKALLGDSYCPASIKAVHIDKSVQMSIGIAGLRGLYFEGLCIGGSAHGASITDLPRLKSGEKSVNQQRIEQQAEVFKTIVKERPIEIKETQVTITVPYNDKFELVGTLDFMGFMDDKKELAIVDLKLTGSIYREHNYDGFGAWSWEFPHNMNFLQAYMYTYLVKEQFKVDAPFYYMVFDYKPESEYKIIRKKVERMHIMELMESIRQTVEKIEFHEATGWKFKPAYKNCINCPLKNTCTEKDLKKPISIL